MFNPFLGHEYREEDILNAFSYYSTCLDYYKPELFYTEVATLISRKNVIGWFQGRSECGPRALGNRSIIADPRYPEMKTILNEKVKFRENFRPFAPAVPYEYQNEYFDLNISSPYMLLVCNVLESKKELIPSAVHYDGTARLQTVHKELSPHLYHLLLEFKKITGVPVLLNTSFNIKGEPIVETPLDACKCFVSTHMDYLCIFNYIAVKKKKYEEVINANTWFGRLWTRFFSLYLRRRAYYVLY